MAYMKPSWKELDFQSFKAHMRMVLMLGIVFILLVTTLIFVTLLLLHKVYYVTLYFYV